ncbi:hypothetical protein [Streptomyces roseirectus]|uniref:hypothetical protein n=1 Tax=Streptomyces roseirectus TaxID=2768066 RepID=UPI001FE53D47|nr:hypothetical protein [Streptomyces roseirectus]
MALSAAPVGLFLVKARQGIDTAVVEPTNNTSPSRTPSPTPADTPARPATDAQLLDGITFTEAADGLRKCIAFDRQGAGPPGDEGLGSPAEYRILLAMRSTGDSNVPGDGVFVVAVRDAPRPARLICTLRDGEARGVNASSGGPEETSHPLTPDPNAGRLYQQSFLDRGRWKLPFRWGVIGTLTPGVTRVTAEYGGSAPVEATLDHGWYVATGTLLRQTTRAPHLKGYDSRGTLVYDSNEDETYQSTLP